jgi:hypothetical protein
VVVYRFDREPVRGYAAPGAWGPDAEVEVMTPSGTVARLPQAEVKVVCFVREFDGAGWAGEQRVFKSRPKSEGLWVRAHFRDNDYLEGIMANDLSQLDAHGFLLSPPDAASNTQRVLIPKSALKELKVLGVVGSPAHKRKPTRAPDESQIGLFEQFR